MPRPSGYITTVTIDPEQPAHNGLLTAHVVTSAPASAVEVRCFQDGNLVLASGWVTTREQDYEKSWTLDSPSWDSGSAQCVVGVVDLENWSPRRTRYLETLEFDAGGQ